MTEVVMPDLGQETEEATINKWFFEEGDPVEAGENLAEVTADSGTFQVPAPASGILMEIFFEEGDDAEVGEVIATIEPE